LTLLKNSSQAAGGADFKETSSEKGFFMRAGEPAAHGWLP
jgi:hypothetical protein